MKRIFKTLGYFFFEVSCGIWGSSTSKWSRFLKINNNRVAWRIAMPIRRIGTYFYGKVL